MQQNPRLERAGGFASVKNDYDGLGGDSNSDNLRYLRNTIFGQSSNGDFIAIGGIEYSAISLSNGQLTTIGIQSHHEIR